MADELIQVQPGYGLEGQPADQPAANVYPYGRQPGNIWLPSDGTSPEILKPDGMGGYVWASLTGGGGVSAVVAGAGIQVTGPAATPTVSMGFPGQTKGDLPYYNGLSWVRLPIGTFGQIPTVNDDGSGDPQLFYRTILADAPCQVDLVGGTNLTARFGFPGPPFSATPQQPGDIIRCLAAYPIQWERYPIGPNGTVLTAVGGLPAWAPVSGAVVPVNWDLYVSPAGNDGNDGLTPATALRTLDRAVQLAPPQWTGQGIVHLAAGAYNVEPVWEWILPHGVGSDKGVLLFDAPLTTVLAAQVSAAGSSQGGLAVFGTVVSPTPLVPNAHAGQILAFTSGLNTGNYRILENDATTITIVGAFPTFDVLGQTFEVLDESAEITLAVPPPNGLNIIAGELGVCFSGCKIDLNGSVLVGYNALMYNCSRFTGALGNGQIIIPQLGQFTYAGEALVPTPTAGFHPNCGPESAFSIGAVDGARVGISSAWCRQPVQALSNSVVFANNIALTENGGFLAFQSSVAQVQNVRAVGATPPQQGVLMADRGSVLEAYNVDINSSATGGIAVAENSWFTGIGLIGTGNTGYGFFCYNSSRAHVPDANIGSNITGTLGDCQVGNNAAPATWLQIQTGLTPDVTDTGAALPSYSAVTL